ncbi:hypothetical protein DUI87_16920 [Hirundo rustica rustica]|uniref:Uncharacterized protein n=1 Tax=Hirundo rustica rustica TaxID=333673 RepID=A0A3M0K333_HIRRU|nr:hypothetical protein DUI87_16920 [Hirundo rustica rustica]
MIRDEYIYEKNLIKYLNVQQMCKKDFRQKNPAVDTAEQVSLPLLSRGEGSPLNMLAVLFLMPSRKVIITFDPALEIVFKLMRMGTLGTQGSSVSCTKRIAYPEPIAPMSSALCYKICIERRQDLKLCDNEEICITVDEGAGYCILREAVQLALDIAEREKWPKLYLYTDSWMVANALWGWLDKWKKANWQRRGKPIWAADEWKDIATRVEKLPVEVRHVDAHVPKSQANEEHRNNEQVDQAAKIEVSKIDLDWQHKGELFLARWAHDASGHQGRDATYKWAQDRGVDLTMDSISQVIHDCETCAAIKQAKRVKPLWYSGRWSKYKYGEAWQIDYITLPQTRQGKRYMLTMVEATTGWLETYPVPHTTAQNTILGLGKQILWRHGTPERTESDNGTHFKKHLG